MSTILLLGMMGSGKTTVGALLAQNMNLTFYDLDQEILATAASIIGRSPAGNAKQDQESANNKVAEKNNKITISGIFSTLGEEGFRRIELLAFKHITKNKTDCVISLGGGAFLQNDIKNYKGVSIWLDAPLDLLWERVGKDQTRPLAKNYQLFSNLYQKRLPDYALADVRIKIDYQDNPEAVTKKTIEELKKLAKYTA